MLLTQLDIHMRKNESRHRLYTFQKINSEWIVELNVKYTATQLLEDNIGENLGDLGFDDNFLDATSFKSFCSAKKTL